MSCHSHNVQELAYNEQLTKAIPATDETHVEGQNHSLACTNWRSKDLLTKGGNISSSMDTKLTVSKGAICSTFDRTQCLRTQQTVPTFIHVLTKKWHFIKQRQSLQRQIF